MFWVGKHIRQVKNVATWLRPIWFLLEILTCCLVNNGLHTSQVAFFIVLITI